MVKVEARESRTHYILYEGSSPESHDEVSRVMHACLVRDGIWVLPLPPHQSVGGMA
jgi:hypothetical protein